MPDKFEWKKIKGQLRNSTLVEHHLFISTSPGEFRDLYGNVRRPFFYRPVNAVYDEWIMKRKINWKYHVRYSFEIQTVSGHNFVFEFHVLKPWNDIIKFYVYTSFNVPRRYK